MKNLTMLALLAGAVAVYAGPAQAKGVQDIPGPTISSTLIITEDSQLTGDVRCTVIKAPCIQFGAPGITLSLNGFFMLGNASPHKCPRGGALEQGIDTNGQDSVTIKGPGAVALFRRNGILVTGNSSRVADVVVALNCRNGIAVRGNNDTIKGNTVVRWGLDGNFFDGIEVAGSGGHHITFNEVVGGGQINTSTNPFTAGGADGIFIVSGSNNNVLRGNESSGNPGRGIVVDVGSTGNTLERNVTIGNLFRDISDDNPAGSSSYADNLCGDSGGADKPPCPNFPNLAGHYH